MAERWWQSKDFRDVAFAPVSDPLQDPDYTVVSELAFRPKVLGALALVASLTDGGFCPDPASSYLCSPPFVAPIRSCMGAEEPRSLPTGDVRGFCFVRAVDEQQAEQIADALRARGYDVWRDDQLPAHRSYGEVIEERLEAAKAVVVVWSLEAIGSQWVRAEADRARKSGTLVQLTVDGSLPPIPFNRIQCADLREWQGETDAPGWQKVEASIASLTGGPAATAAAALTKECAPQKVAICSAIRKHERRPGTGIFQRRHQRRHHYGSVKNLGGLGRGPQHGFPVQGQGNRREGRRYRIRRHARPGSSRSQGWHQPKTAQLIDGRAGDHVWAERYDRELPDIFDMQDETRRLSRLRSSCACCRRKRRRSSSAELTVRMRTTSI